ncbi:MAG: PDGLE domain-containing protein [bacterium]
MKNSIIFGLIVALICAGLISLFASSFPDGLEKVAENLGFLEKGEGEPILKSPIPDYALPGIKNEKLATSIAGIVGTLLVFVVGYGTAEIIRKINSKRETEN